jgi:energy-coupling factor transporter transmembrane protein EcfT
MTRKGGEDLRRRDTALALAFLLLLVWLFTGRDFWVHAVMGLLVLAMVFPGAMALPAKAWFGLSRILGGVMSRVILTGIFFLIVCPVALVRRAAGKDALGLKKWKRDDQSVFFVREHVFTEQDLHNPY